MAGLTRRAALLSAGAAIGVAGTRYLKSSNPSYDGVEFIKPKGGANVLNDASSLSETPVHKHLTLSGDPSDKLITALRSELKEAQAAGRPVNIGAARHSMGAQAIPRGGHAITFDSAFVEPDTTTQTYRAHAGARWSNVIATLDPLGFSPAVMQSNNDFGLAATYSVNAHGWPVPYGPMGATVKSLRMVLPSGDLVTCSRSENAELFNLAMGGYGLIGLIVDMEIDMVKNQRLVPTFEELNAKDFGVRFIDAINKGDVNMAYGRLNVDRARFFEDALMITYRSSDDQSDLPAASGSGLPSKIAARVYRWQLGNERMKRFRWWMETDVGPATSGASTRNSLINEPVQTLDDRNPNRTDILHEYFVAPERFPEFLEVCRAVIPKSFQEFLNVTLRYIGQDDESYLSYANVPRIAAVMSFSQEMTQRGEADMKRMTEALIEGIISIGGTYYLPYRPHARRDQLRRAYPRAAEFAARKRALDPKLTLRNALWDNYIGVQT